ncbi:hypothetical protein [Nostoc sp. MG11]|uniref:hypothetical protein n=1 Tax=Nostoc sp. MG11 TaxID=2721166 RepID=UPI001D00FDE6|nr:hypothetical protein [Nostoc sp. MG11]
MVYPPAVGDRTTALTQLQQCLETHLVGAEIISLSVNLSSTSSILCRGSYSLPCPPSR